ncbi:MAG TPA: GntR family transcriptional regulator [Eubacteriales bacterium]|nr:GntR family transcriptional regulator [Eubacteriales bacterium]
MDIVILEHGEKPIYEQLFEQVMAQILSGKLPAGFCLPSMRTLAADLSISIITVKKAYEMLEAAGLIYTRAGKGCFVAEHGTKKLDDKKFALASEQLKKDLLYYKNLRLTRAELIEMIKAEWEDND